MCAWQKGQERGDRSETSRGPGSAQTYGVSLSHPHERVQPVTPRSAGAALRVAVVQLARLQVLQGFATVAVRRSGVFGPGTGTMRVELRHCPGWPSRGFS
jgi:nucleoside-diphosphate-sugar epimerase